MKKNKRFICNCGYVRDVRISKSTVEFKTFNVKKNSLSLFGVRKLEWVKNQYKFNQVALCYEENGKIVLIAEV